MGDTTIKEKSEKKVEKARWTWPGNTTIKAKSEKKVGKSRADVVGKYHHKGEK